MKKHRYDIRDRHVADGTTKEKDNEARRFGRARRFPHPSKALTLTGPGEYNNHVKDTAIKLGKVLANTTIT